MDCQSVLPFLVDNIDLHIFVDHSIMDVFINEKWAASVRLFPTDVDATDVEAFSEGNTTFTNLEAWTLDKNATTNISSNMKNMPLISVENGYVRCSCSGISPDAVLSVYSLNGMLQNYCTVSDSDKIPIKMKTGILKVNSEGKEFSVKFTSDR